MIVEISKQFYLKIMLPMFFQSLHIQNRRSVSIKYIQIAFSSLCASARDWRSHCQFLSVVSQERPRTYDRTVAGGPAMGRPWAMRLSKMTTYYYTHVT